MNETKLLVHQFRGNVVGHALAENRYCKLVSFPCAQHSFGGFKKRLVARRSGEHMDAVAEQQEPEDITVAIAATLDEADWIAAKLDGVAEPG
jgi:hypothetical protein